MIKRDFYLDKLIKTRKNGDVKVITGIRRAGKSVLLFDLFKDYLLNEEKIEEKNIIAISLDKRKDFKFRDPIYLSDYIEKNVTSSKEFFYLFIDEIQMSITTKDELGYNVTIYDMLNELKDIKNLDIYVTGSNSKMLSSDILTEFRGRSTQIHVFPLSFREIYEHEGGERKLKLDEYMTYGGMPKLLEYTDESDKKKYLTNLFNEVYLKDIIERNKIEKKDILNSILDYLSSSVGSLTNPNTIANVLSNEKKEKISSELVSSYIDDAKDAFVISMAKRYDIKGKAYFKYPNKYYYVDPGLRNARLNFRQFDPGHIMENIIYVELLRRGYSADVGVVEDRRNGTYITKEIDFVVNDGDKRTYIQSALKIDEEKKKDSELESLRLTGDFFKKVVIQNDIEHNFYDDMGFYHVSLFNFLLGENIF